ncbi:MAG: RNA polymerase sigma factor [Bacteroidales bacterium]|nr:RNA polymerase sigma factor [Bacteroidales bacterium]MDD4712601.1 RNA polymerase sigma factor [Bacteroidales bacterium]
MEHQNEMDCIRRIIDGETTLFSTLLKRYSRPIHSMIVRIVPCREDAEELTQDTFIKAFRKLDTFKGDCSFSTWLYRIAYNTAISATRKKKVSFPLLDDNAYHHIPDDAVDELLDKEEDEELLYQMEQAIELLNVEEKALITLYYTEEKPIQVISSILQITPDNVKVKLYRTRKKIYTLVKNK